MGSEKKLPQSGQNEDKQGYEAPRIESVMTPEALAREVQYAGTVDNTIPVNG